MISQAAQNFNRSTHQLTDVVQLAQQSPEEAADYLRQLENVIEQEAATVPAAAPLESQLEAIINQTGNLAEAITARAAELSPLFPSPATTQVATAQAQANGAASVGFNATPATPAKPVRVTGTVRNDNGVLRLETPGGKSLLLAESARRSNRTYFPQGWSSGLIADGPITVKGIFGSDGQSFNVEEYALNVDGRYDTMQTSRMTVTGGSFQLTTPAGTVSMTNAAFACAFSENPQLKLYVAQATVGTGAAARPILVAVTETGALLAGQDAKSVQGQPRYSDLVLPPFDPANPGAPWVQAQVSNVTPVSVVMNAQEGDIPVAHPEFKKLLANLDRLGIIVPGEAELNADGQLTYALNPASYFGLGRITDGTKRIDESTGETYVLGVMAYNNFNGRIYIPADVTDDRLRHGGRMWTEGNYVLGPDYALQFRSRYISQQTDMRSTLSGPRADADLFRNDALSIDAGHP